MKKSVLVVGLTLILITLFYVLPVFIQSRSLSFRLDSDYDVIFSYYTYIVAYFRSYHLLPQNYPFAGSGLPLLGDPFLSIFNPIFLLSIIVFNVDLGLKMYIFLCVLLSGFSMSILLRSLKISSKIVLWGSALYMVSGAFAARVAAGHVNFFFSFVVWPIFFLLAINPVNKTKTLIGCSIALSFMFLSGDVYGVVYMMLFYVAIKFFYLIKYSNIRLKIFQQSLLTLFIVLLVSSPKIYAFLVDVLPYMERFANSKISTGSIHAPFMLFQFIIPWRVLFYDRPFFQRLLGFNFNWYEYYSFISVLPFFFLIKIRKITLAQAAPFLIVFVLGGLWLAQGYSYSPFYYFFQNIPLLSVIRVPQRIVMPLTACVIAFFSVLAHSIYNSGNLKIRILMIIVFFMSFLWTFFVGQATLKLAFETPRSRELEFVEKFKKINLNEHKVVNFLCCIQTMLVKNNISIVNFYGAWQKKGTPRFVNDESGEYELSELLNVRPKYVLAKNNLDLTGYNYEKVMIDSVGTVWNLVE